MENKSSWKCIICGLELSDYEPQYCCDGIMCGCMGMPTEPPVCSQECFDKLMERNRQGHSIGNGNG